MSDPMANVTEMLSADFDGRLVGRDDPAYDEARKIWNGQIDRQPALIAQCSGPADVVAAVRAAREHQIDASVRGGGHAVAGHALCDGMVIDLSTMTGVRVDPAGPTVRVQGGCLNSHLDRETQAFGLTTTSGVVSHTGVAGLTLGGGIGHLMRKYGLTIDNLRSCDVITAEGDMVVDSNDENPDLFWGLRGGGGNFGIVTSFEFELHPLGPIVLAGLVAWAMDDAPGVLRLLADQAANGPDELCLLGNLRLCPPLPVFPDELHGAPIVAIALCYAGSVEDGDAVLAPIRGFGEPLVDLVMPKPYSAHQKMLDPAVAHGQHYYWKSHKLPPLDDAIIEVIVDQCRAITSPQSSVPIFTQGGAVARVSEDATAFPNRDAAHDINILASWPPDDPDPDRHKAWVRRFFDALEPHSAGVYVNFTSDDTSARVREMAYGPEKWKRLVSLKQQYDPTNFFRFNANIPPTG